MANEDLTPTPTQAEMDEIMAKLTGSEVPKKREARSVKDVPDAVATPPHMTQAENDAAMAAAAPGDFPPEPEPQKRDAKNKEMEAEKPAGYQTRAAASAATPVKK